MPLHVRLKGSTVAEPNDVPPTGRTDTLRALADLIESVPLPDPVRVDLDSRGGWEILTVHLDATDRFGVAAWALALGVEGVEDGVWSAGRRDRRGVWAGWTEVRVAAGGALEEEEESNVPHHSPTPQRVDDLLAEAGRFLDTGVFPDDDEPAVAPPDTPALYRLALKAAAFLAEHGQPIDTRLTVVYQGHDLNVERRYVFRGGPWDGQERWEAKAMQPGHCMPHGENGATWAAADAWPGRERYIPAPWSCGCGDPTVLMVWRHATVEQIRQAETARAARYDDFDGDE